MCKRAGGVLLYDLAGHVWLYTHTLIYIYTHTERERERAMLIKWPNLFDLFGFFFWVRRCGSRAG